LIVYLDTSSLVKLFVQESGSDQVHSLIAGAETTATSVIAYTEARSAFARRGREGALTKAEYELVRAAFDLKWANLLALDVTQAIARHAADLAELHGLRAFDGLHLASYRSIVAEAPDEVVRFSSFDTKLSAAARGRSRLL
jgi:predicted nucleic acid-binding protein